MTLVAGSAVLLSGVMLVWRRRIASPDILTGAVFVCVGLWALCGEWR